MIAPNGKKIAISGELYKNKEHAVKMAHGMNERFDGAEFVVTDPRGKVVPKFKARDKVRINAGDWGAVSAVVVRKGLKVGMWMCKVTAGPHKGHVGTWSEVDIKKAKQ